MARLDRPILALYEETGSCENAKSMTIGEVWIHLDLCVDNRQAKGSLLLVILAERT
jgi:hypothetical protein